MKRSYSVTQRPQRPRMHPGHILRETVLPALGLSVSEAAKMLRVSRQTLHRILAETHAVTPEMALRLGKFCGNGPELWLDMQTGHDLWHAERRMKAAIARIPTPEPAKPPRRRKSA